MFLSMVSAPNEVGAPLSRDTFAQRFNVAASRARDRMYLVRSVELEHLSKADRLRRSLIAHFATPFAQDELRVEDLRTLCESPFEREMYDELTQRGYWITPQVRVGQYRIDMVVEGHNDARLAVECDGDKYHGADKWADDMQRQRVLERAGWVFWRCFASAFIRRRRDMLDDLVKTLAERGIEPIGAEGAPRSVHSEHRVVPFVTEPAVGQGTVMPVDSFENAQASIPEAPPAQTSSARGDARPVYARVHPSTGDGNLFGRAQLIVPSVNSRDANLPFTCTNHIEWDCKYHIIVIPKYRKKVLYGKLRDRLGAVFQQLAHRKDCAVAEGHLMGDHVHMMVSIPPKYAVASVVGFLKGKSAIWIAREFNEVTRGFVGKHFWARGCFVSTVGRDEETIRKYIRHQESEDRRIDQLGML